MQILAFIYYALNLFIHEKLEIKLTIINRMIPSHILKIIFSIETHSVRLKIY